MNVKLSKSISQQAAHCLDDLISINVQAGVTRLFRPPAYEARVFPRDVRMHPRYNPETLINDIALIFLQRRIIFNTEMQRILLPPRSHANNRFVGSLGTVIGWGRTSDCKFEFNSHIYDF